MTSPNPSAYNYHYPAENAPQPSAEGERDSQNRLYEPYVLEGELLEALNLAIDLNRPILLEGDPGCGKTRLPKALVYYLTQTYLAGQLDDQGKPLWWPYFEWNVKSVSRAREGLYTYDGIDRLRDAQLVGTNFKELAEILGPKESDRLKERLLKPEEYLKFGPLGKALKESEKRAIVLIDEVDKADSDFLNDLLRELDEFSFDVPELGQPLAEENQPKGKPIVILTSNRERPLPEPFLRRCLYFYVEFPGELQLRNIVEKRFGKNQLDEDVLTNALERFEKVRDLTKRGARQPGTSEFLDFLKALLNLSPETALTDLNQLAEKRPLLGTLLKNKTDRDFVAAQLRQEKAGDD
jgi:MoxR-like ATPase